MNVPDTVGVPLMVMVLLAQKAVTPAGKLVGLPIPVALKVVCVMAVSAVLTRTDGELEAGPTPMTEMVPVALRESQPPVNGMAYVNVPAAVGVPLMVMVLLAHEAVTPAGKPDGTPMSVALMVVCVMAVSAVLTHRVGELEAGETDTTVMIPETVPQPPVKETV